MLFPVLQALWQQIGPQATQFVNSPAFLELLKNLGRVPPHIYLQGGRFVSQNVSDWYQKLSPEEKQRWQDAMVWIAKDMAGDVAAAATGLPIGSLVDLGVEKLFSDDNTPKQEKSSYPYDLRQYLKP
jgi:hypothetical protein